MLNSLSSYLGVGLVLLQLAHAVPSSLAARATTDYESNFDDIQPADGFASTQLINVYNELFWSSFVLVRPGSNGAISSAPVVGSGLAGTLPNQQTGVIPHSRPQAAAFTDVTQIEQGSPSLTTVYSGSSPTKRLTLYSFWWGVAANLQENIATTPQNAQLTVIGYKTPDDTVSQTYDYDFNSLIQQMKLATLPSKFMNLTHVDFSISTIASGDAVKVIFDNVKYQIIE